MQIRSVNTLKLLIRQLDVPHEMHGSRMMIPIAALDELQREAIVRDIRASDQGHDLTPELDGDDDLSLDQLELLEQGRPGRVPWQAERTPDGAPS